MISKNLQRQITMEDEENIFLGIKQPDIWPEIDQSSSSSSDKNKNKEIQVNSHQLLDLYSGKEKFLNFVQEIGELRKASIREDILNFCEKLWQQLQNIESFYKSETILRKIQSRIQKMIKTKRIKKNWGDDDIIILVWILSKYSDWKNYQSIQKQINQQDWIFIASLIPGVTPESCMFRWLSLKKITLSSNSWSDYQSQLLGSIVKQRNNNVFKHNSQIQDWKQISQQLYRINVNQNKVYRNAKQCRQHWSCYLSPQLKKGPWQLYEDVRLLTFIQKNNGQKKWSEISKHFEGRTENALKNRYTLIIDKQKKIAKNYNKTQLQLVKEYLQKCYFELYTSEKQQNQHFQEKSNNFQIKNQINQNYKSYPTNSSYCEYQNSSNKKISNKKNIKEDIFQESDSESIFEQINDDQNLNEIPVTPSLDQITFNQNSQLRPTVTLKVQKFKLTDFSKIGMQDFFRKIQPGIIDSTGNFKKLTSSSVQQEWRSSINKIT